MKILSVALEVEKGQRSLVISCVDNQGQRHRLTRARNGTGPRLPTRTVLETVAAAASLPEAMESLTVLESVLS